MQLRGTASCINSLTHLLEQVIIVTSLCFVRLPVQVYNIDRVPDFSGSYTLLASPSQNHSTSLVQQVLSKTTDSCVRVRVQSPIRRSAVHAGSESRNSPVSALAHVGHVGVPIMTSLLTCCPATSLIWLLFGARMRITPRVQVPTRWSFDRPGGYTAELSSPRNPQK